MLLTWTLQTQGLAEVGSTVANGGAEHEQVTAVKADCGREQLPVEADAPASSEDGPNIESLVAPVATARVDADSGDERSLEDGRADAPAVDVPGACEAHVTRDRPRRYVRAPLGLPDLFFRRVARRVARARPPLGDADRTRRRHAFTLLRSELDRRALGTLGPRGPPAV